MYDIETYNRLSIVSKAEDILSSKKIYIDTEYLKSQIALQPENTVIYEYLSHAIKNGGYISTKYTSKEIVTNRMFTQKGCLNLITLNDGSVLHSMRSRYEDGVILCLDYKQFEINIINKIVNGINLPDDLHTWASSLLGCDRQSAKRYNMSILYSKNIEWSFDRIYKECVQNTTTENLTKYITKMSEVHDIIENFASKHRNFLDEYGYIANHFGRKVYPKSPDNIFSNIVQSTGSEILADAVINVDNLLNGIPEAHLLFHRFDSLYFDASKESLLNHIKEIKNCVESAWKESQLEVGINIGRNMNCLKELNSG